MIEFFELLDRCGRGPTLLKLDFIIGIYQGFSLQEKNRYIKGTPAPAAVLLLWQVVTVKGCTFGIVAGL